MKQDRLTKVLLTAIASALWLNLLTGSPTAVGAQTRAAGGQDRAAELLTLTQILSELKNIEVNTNRIPFSTPERPSAVSCSGSLDSADVRIGRDASPVEKFRLSFTCR